MVVFTFHVGERVLVLIIPWEVPGQTAARGSLCGPCGCPVGHSPDPLEQVQPMGGLTTGTNICARTGGEVRDLWCKFGREKPGDEGCGGLAWTENPLLYVWHWQGFSEGSVWLSHCSSANEGANFSFSTLSSGLGSGFRAQAVICFVPGRLMQAITWECDGNGFHPVSCERTPGVSAKPRASCQVHLCVSILLICADTEIPQTSLRFQSRWEKIPAFPWHWKSQQAQRGALGICLGPAHCVPFPLCHRRNPWVPQPRLSVRQLQPKHFWLEPPKKTPHICNVFMALLAHLSSLWSLLMKGMKN